MQAKFRFIKNKVRFMSVCSNKKYDFQPNHHHKHRKLSLDEVHTAYRQAGEAMYNRKDVREIAVLYDIAEELNTWYRRQQSRHKIMENEPQTDTYYCEDSHKHVTHDFDNGL